MLWLRGLLFSLGPGVLWGLAPYWLSGSKPLQRGWWQLGWIPLCLGAAVYLSCLLNFLATIYGLAAWLLVHLGVVRVEEPHLRAKHGQSYQDYCRRVPRWLGIPR